MPTQFNPINLNTLDRHITAHKEYVTKYRKTDVTQFDVLYTKEFYQRLVDIADIYNTKFGMIQKILQHDFTLLHTQDGTKYHQLDEEFSHITELLNMPRDAIFLLLKSYNTVVPVSCKDDIQVDEAIVPKEIISPKSFTFGNIVWSPGENRPLAKLRYIPNYEVHSARKAFMQAKEERKHAIEKDPKDTSIQNVSKYKEADLYLNILDVTINQTRGINISRLVLSAMLTYNVRPNKHTIHHCDKCQNPAIYYLQKLFNNYQSWPFLDTVRGMYYPPGPGLSTQLPTLVYSILNRSISYTLGVVTTGLFNLCMKTYFEWAIISLDDMHLEQKGDMNNVRKLLHTCLLPSTIPQYSQVGVTSTRYIEKFNEFWISDDTGDERKKLESIVRNKKTTRAYFNVILDCLKRKFTRDKLSLLKMGLACATNNTTFKKSSPTLEYDRSAQPRLHNPTITKAATLKWEGFPITPNYTGLYDTMWKALLDLGNKIKPEMAKHDFESEFYDRLTNRSSGATSEHVSNTRKVNELLKMMPDLPYGQRYISALIDSSVLSNRESALEAISQRIKAGKREQIDRRSRWIMMVSNVLQSVFSIALSFGREVTKISKYIASGKQVGDIRDMLQILIATSQRYSVITDNDIKGMDSSTQEHVADMIIHAVFHSLNDLYIPTFFYAREQDVRCTKYDDEGRVIQDNIYIHLNAAQVFIADVVSHMRSASYEFNEKWLDWIMYIPGSVFWSGAFHTAVQHNVLLSTVLDELQSRANTYLAEFQARFEGAVMGDDISLHLTFNDDTLLTDAAAVSIISQLQKLLLDLGFISDPESSRYQATFLQQTAFLGGVEPKHARLSLIVSESGASRSRDPFQQIKEVGDILDELSGRSPSPESAIPILLSIWAVGRAMSVNILKKGDKKRKTVHVHNDYKPWINFTNTKVFITIPFVAIYVPEIFGATPPPMYLPGHGILRPSFFSPKGSFFYWFLSHAAFKILSDSEREKLKTSVLLTLKQKIEIKIKKGLLSREKGELLLQRQPYIKLQDRLNQELLFTLGFSFSQYLYQIIPRSSKMLPQEKNNPAFIRLVDIGKQKQNMEMVSHAYFGKVALNDAGFEVSEGLAYYNQPAQRIEQACVLQREKKVTVNLYNDAILEKLFKVISSPNILKFTLPNDSIIDFDFSKTSTAIRLASEYDILKDVSLGCCSPVGSLSHTLTLLFGTPFNNPSRDRILDIVKGDLGVGADTEQILEQGLKIYNSNPYLLHSFFAYIGLPSYAYTKTEKLLIEYAQFRSIEYTSVLNVRKHFYMSTHTSHARRFIGSSIQYKKPMKWNVVQLLIARDLLCAFPEITHTLIIHPSQYLLNRLVCQWV